MQGAFIRKTKVSCLGFLTQARIILDKGVSMKKVSHKESVEHFLDY